MKKILSLIAVAILLSSCATIVSKSSSMVGVDTTPQGATVQIFNRKGEIVYNGHTPATLSLKHASGFFKKASYQVKLSMDGYEPKTVVINAHVNGWYWGNLVFGGVIGFLIIDPATGAMYKLNNDYVDEKMTLKVVTLKDIPAGWRKDLVRLQ
jgi:hypothetical protein